MSHLDHSWQEIQHKTFTKWLVFCFFFFRKIEKNRLNTRLSSLDLTPAVSLKTDLSDGIRLICLLV